MCVTFVSFEDFVQKSTLLRKYEITDTNPAGHYVERPNIYFETTFKTLIYGAQQMIVLTNLLFGDIVSENFAKEID